MDTMALAREKDFDLPTIPEYFTGQSILVTGATGFMGKVLVEKLLRSCPDLERIYLIIRVKKGLAIEERWKKVTDLPLFDRLKKERPGQLEKKIKLIPGDCLEPNLGLSAEDKKELEENVSIVYNSAASVRFDDPLKKAVFMNTRCTRDLVQMALNMKKIQVFIHISTTYCNTDKQVLEEAIMPAHADWSKTIDLAEKYDDNVLNILTPKYMGELPNTYTFTKSLAEHVVDDLGNKKIPCVIFRPSIVIASLHEPMPGWVDNFNGPVGLIIACGKGILRTSFCDPSLASDYIPVDLVVKTLIVTTWKKGTEKIIEKKNELQVYNACVSDKKVITMGEMIEIAKSLALETPLNNPLWHPGGGVTHSKVWNYIKVIVLHLLPALILEPILRLAKAPISLLTIQRKIYIANMALSYFINHHWNFKNEKLFKLEDDVLPEDHPDFAYNFQHTDPEEYFYHASLGGRLYLLKEDNGEGLEKAKVNAKRMYWLDKVVNCAFWYYVIYYTLTWGWYLLQVSAHRFTNYVINL